jgi:membrane protease YdiL (CAAX protease family)
VQHDKIYVEAVLQSRHVGWGLSLRRAFSFTAGCLLELALLVLALVWGGVFHRPVLANIHWSWYCALIGIVASVPPFAFFVWTLNSRLHACSRHKELMERLLRPLFGHWNIMQLLVISLIAGISEEAFFRGAIQGSLEARVGMILGLILASIAFGACHLITWTCTWTFRGPATATAAKRSCSSAATAW